jgi:hypothetical protein
MSKDWVENLEKHLPPSVGHAIEDADHAIHDFAQHVHLAYWHPISTAPCNQDVELRIAEAGEILTLEFPCLQTNAGEWIDVDLGTRIEIQPVEWRIWQRSKSPQPHHSKVRPNDRSALLHHDNRNTERPTSIEIDDTITSKPRS